jgi:hypothetical protein
MNTYVKGTKEKQTTFGGIRLNSTRKAQFLHASEKRPAEVDRCLTDVVKQATITKSDSGLYLPPDFITAGTLREIPLPT